jgi:hypothetical protein
MLQVGGGVSNSGCRRHRHNEEQLGEGVAIAAGTPRGQVHFGSFCRPQQTSAGIMIKQGPSGVANVGCLPRWMSNVNFNAAC